MQGCLLAIQVPGYWERHKSSFHLSRSILSSTCFFSRAKEGLRKHWQQPGAGQCGASKSGAADLDWVIRKWGTLGLGGKIQLLTLEFACSNSISPVSVTAVSLTDEGEFSKLGPPSPPSLCWLNSLLRWLRYQSLRNICKSVHTGNLQRLIAWPNLSDLSLAQQKRYTCHKDSFLPLPLPSSF